MAIYTVHTSPNFSGDLNQLDQVEFVKEGFSWVALLVPYLWFLWHGLWLSFLLYLLFSVMALVTVIFVSETLVGIVTLLLSVLIALEANQLRRWKLERNGWLFVGIVSGRNRDECESKFYSNLIHEQRLIEKSAVETVQHITNSSTADDDPASKDQVVGLFPRPVIER